MKTAMIFPNRESEKAISGYSVTLTENIRKKGLDIDDLTYTAGRPWSLLKQVWKIRGYDVVHVQHEYNLLGWYGLPFFLFYFMLSFSNTKVVTTMHTALSLKEKYKEGGNIKTFLRKWLYRTQNRVINWWSDRVVVHADFFKKILIEEYGYRREKCVIFPQAVIEDVKMTAKEKAKKKLKLRGPVYLLIGSLGPLHGHDIVVSQAKKVGGTVLVVANPYSVNDRNQERTKNYLNELKRIVAEKKLEKIVRFDVFEINDKKPEWWEYFCAADLVLLPYRGGIGSGIFAHAMATKTPVVASNILFFNEISRNFDCLKIAKKDSDFPKVIKESMKPANYKKMKAECERYFGKFRLSKLAKEYIEVYKKL